MSKFDDRSHQFTMILAMCSSWEHNFFGAAYSTRIKHAIECAKKELDDMEKWMRANSEW